jgi:hypothetical protein
MHGFVSEVTGDFHRIAFRFETLPAITFFGGPETAGVTEVCVWRVPCSVSKVDPTPLMRLITPLVPRIDGRHGCDDGQLSVPMHL